MLDKNIFKHIEQPLSPFSIKKNHGKKQIKVKFYRKKDLARNIESLIVEVNSDGSIEKRQFADEKAAYEYIETLKKEKS